MSCGIICVPKCCKSIRGAPKRCHQRSWSRSAGLEYSESIERAGFPVVYYCRSQEMSKTRKTMKNRIFMVFHGFSYFWQKLLQICGKSSFDGKARPEKHRLSTSGGKKVVCDVIFLSVDIVRAGWATHFSRMRPRPGPANYFWGRYQTPPPPPSSSL